MIVEGLGWWHLPTEYVPISGAKAEKVALNEEVKNSGMVYEAMKWRRFSSVCSDG